MPRGPKKHLKRVNAPKHWMLDKMAGTFAPRPSAGPHKLRECLPLMVFIRNRLKYALNKSEVVGILKQRLVQVDGKHRTDPTYPAGFMDVISMEKTGEHFRLLYNVRGRFAVHRIKAQEAEYKLCRVKKQSVGKGGIPYIVTHDGRTIRYPDPDIKANDTVKIDIESGKITEFLKMEVNQLVMVTGGHNIGRVGILTQREKHLGSHESAHVKDAAGKSFTTRTDNIFVIGTFVDGKQRSYVSLPKGKGIKMTIMEEAAHSGTA